jgi:hypothetical protein
LLDKRPRFSFFKGELLNLLIQRQDRLVAAEACRQVNTMSKLLHSFYRTVLLLFFSLVLTVLLPKVPVFGQTQLSGGQTRILTNAQSGTTYTILASDCGKLISFSNASPVAVTLPQAGPAGLPGGCWMDIQNTGSGTVLVTPVTSLIDQAASLQLTTNQGARLVSNGNGYLTQRGQGSGTGSAGASLGTVTDTAGTLVTGAILTGNGGSDIKAPVPTATMDNSGNISIPGNLISGSACNGCAGAVDLPAGTDPGPAQAANSFSWIAPQSIASSFRWKVPAADAAGAIVSDGAGTPGTLSIVPFSGTGSIVRTTSPVISTPTLVQPVLGNYTVGNLPAGVSSGKLAYVTDGSTATDCTAGGGAYKLLCAYDGGSGAFPGGGSGGGGSTPVYINYFTTRGVPSGYNYFSGGVGITWGYATILPNPGQFGHICVNIVAADAAGTYHLGILGSTGTLLASTAAVTMPNTGVVCTTFSGGTVTIPAGKIYFASDQVTPPGSATLSKAGTFDPYFIPLFDQQLSSSVIGSITPPADNPVPTTTGNGAIWFALIP